MKRIIYLVISLFPIIANCQYKNQMIDSIFKSYFKADEPGAAVLVIKDGKEIYKAGIGIADMETREAITPSTIFNLGSISKPIVAMGILRLAAENKLSLDDDLLKYFPDFTNKAIAQKVKIYHLLTHTSGLPDSRKVKEEHEFYLTAKDEENFAPIKKTESLEFEPGSNYKYSNPAFNGLALIIERVSEMKWQDYIRSIVFQPAGMKTSTITDGPHPEKGVAHAYVPNSNKIGFSELDYGEEPTFAASGNGGVWSSVEELWMMEQAIQRNEILSKEWTKRSREVFKLKNWSSKNPSRLALSWFITEELKKEMIGHTGSQGGFISDYVWIPEKKIFYVLLCNTPMPILEIRQRILGSL
jgi:CubicO group peptidase (beta-lactamase class C family)